MTLPPTADAGLDPESRFALGFARLVSWLARDEGTEAERSRLATALGGIVSGGSVPMLWNNWELRVGERVWGPTVSATFDLVARMPAHGVRALFFAAGAPAAVILDVARALAGAPTVGDGGAGAADRIARAAGAYVRLVTVLPRRSAEAAAPTPASDVPVPAAVAEVDGESVRIISAETADQLIARLTSAAGVAELAKTMDAMAALTEGSRKRLGDTVKLLTALVDAETRLVDPELSRSRTFAIRRIAKPSLFRAMANDLARTPGARDQYLRLFRHFGDEAADQIIQELADAHEKHARRELFHTLVELRHGAATLISMLGDERWYVVRNAAELLGELRAAEAEQSLSWVLSHKDARVRKAAISALSRIGTPGARGSIRAALRDGDPQVRVRAIAALVRGDGASDRATAAALLRAFGEEQPPEVQKALATALMKVGTPEAKRALEEAAQGESRLFRKRVTPLQVAAEEAMSNPKAADGLSDSLENRW